MKAMIIKAFGGPDVFEMADVVKPGEADGSGLEIASEMAATDVLVEVHATSVNPVDYKLRRAGAWAGIEPPAILGYDVSGVVAAVGDAVHDFVVGDEVYYTPDIFAGPGSYAEYHAANEKIVAHKPINLSHTEAASIPLVGSTAWDALIMKAELRVSESVLIHGVGGVGSLAIQLAKAAGAYVIVTCSDYMVDLAGQLGADRAINYKTEDFVDIVKTETDGFGVDVVLDIVGGDVLTRSIEVTKPFGRMVGIVSTEAGLQDAFVKNIAVYPTFLQRARYKLDALRDLIERGKLKPVIDTVMPLEKVAEAHQRLEAGGVKGKLVLEVT